MCGFMVAGAIVTYFMVPQTRDAAGKSRTLEDLAKGRRELSRAEGMS